MWDFTVIDAAVTEAIREMVDEYPQFESFFRDVIESWDEGAFTPAEKRAYVAGLLQGYKGGAREAI